MGGWEGRTLLKGFGRAGGTEGWSVERGGRVSAYSTTFAIIVGRPWVSK